MATVLVVDDRSVTREAARAALDLGGHRVIEAVHGREALAIAQEVHPDVVVTDVVMPGIDGYEFARLLRESPGTADIPVLLYTGNYQPGEAAQVAAAYGVTMVVSKTAPPEELLAAVDLALRQNVAAPVRDDAAAAAAHLSAVHAKLVEKVQALDATEARLSTLADMSPVGIVVGGSDGAATHVNSRLVEIVGWPAAELLGDGWLRCVPPDCRADAIAARDSGQPASLHGEVVTGTAECRWLNVQMRELNDDGRRAGFVATVDDVTAIIEAEKRRSIAERDRVTERFDSLARLSGGIAHDFNNLLGIIMSFGDFAAEALGDAVDTTLTEEVARPIRADLDKIGRAGQRAAQLTSQLLTFGGRELGRPSLVEVNALVTEVCDNVSGELGRHVTLAADLDPGLHPVHADRSQLSQVLHNLAANAREAMPQGGHLRWVTANVKSIDGLGDSAEPPAGWVHVAVQDNGTGMPPEVLERAMEPFFTTKPKGQGTGHGLSMAYGIARQTGGDLRIESAAGAGTTVHLYLPAAVEPIATALPAPARLPATGRVVLIADDEEGVREAAERILNRAGYRTLVATDGQDALEIAKACPGPIDALLTDVVMPRLNGPQLAAELAVRRPGIPVLYMSGYAAPLMAGHGLLEPGVSVVSKPFTRAELLEALRDKLSQGAVSPVG
jgi:two-component system cell cycle sensor histidine kinase/response regulator CckA